MKQEQSTASKSWFRGEEKEVAGVHGLFMRIGDIPGLRDGLDRVKNSSEKKKNSIDKNNSRT